MKIKTILLTIFVLVLMLFSTSAFADVNVDVFTDEASFLSETGAVPIEFPVNAYDALPLYPWGSSLSDYSCDSAANGIILSGNSNTISIHPVVNNYICFIGQNWDAGTNNTNPTPVSPTIVVNTEDDYQVVDFANPVYAIGFELLTNYVADETITLNFGDGTSIKFVDDSNVVPKLNQLDTTPNTFDFVGFKSDKPIISITIDTTGRAIQNEGISAIWIRGNSPPIAEANGPYMVAVGKTVELDGSLSSDPDGDPLTEIWAETGSPTLGSISGSTFTAGLVAGITEVTLTVDDGFGGTATDNAMVVVYDPDGGFVTGGGWFYSPEGALGDVLVWDQGFEFDTNGWFDVNSDWYGLVSQVPSGTNGVPSSDGSFHALFEGDDSSGPFTRFDGYRDNWPGTWTAEIDVYLDPTWVSGQGFDYSVAASGSDGNHQRDYIFHVTKDTSTGALYVAGSNNTNFAPREDLENINHYEVTSAGWYTFQHIFYESSGALAVDLNLLDANGNLVFTETRFNAADTIPTEVGGNRYGWFTFINVEGGIAVDEHQLYMPSTVTGKANFGFVSKYKKGADVPTGNTEFQFKAGDLNFHSSEYEWLVVTGSDYAKFKGTGTINGEGSYKFQIWAGDDDPDTFRIKIWYEEGDSEVVVYDNGMDQAIDGGSIVVHSK